MKKSKGGAVAASAVARFSRFSEQTHSPPKNRGLRTPFQKDRDRLLYSPAFRRLAGVTQVFHADAGHAFHNRLTHSLKVAQVARRLAEYLLRVETPSIVEESGGLDADVTETAALAHDLGHPPFGHMAEEELQEVLSERSIPDSFEGNAQSFRIVTKLVAYSAYSDGLDLTRASLNGILKYPWPRDLANPEGKRGNKWGYYLGEDLEFTFARQGMADDPRQSTEAAIMDWADDVTYAVHDVDDCYRAGLLPLDRLLSNGDETEKFCGWWSKSVTTKRAKQAITKAEHQQIIGKERVKEESRKKWALDRLEEAGKAFIQLTEPFSAEREQQVALNGWISALLGRYLNVGPEAIHLTPSLESRLSIPSDIRDEVDLLKSFMVYYVYESPALRAQQLGQRRIIREIFEVIYAAAEDGKKRGILPQPFLGAALQIDQLHGQAAEAKRRRARLTTDLICSMTEQQAIRFHQRVTGANPGPVMDVILK